MKITFHDENMVIFELSVVRGIKNNVAFIKIRKFMKFHWVRGPLTHSAVATLSHEHIPMVGKCICLNIQNIYSVQAIYLDPYL